MALVLRKLSVGLRYKPKLRLLFGEDDYLLSVTYKTFHFRKMIPRICTELIGVRELRIRTSESGRSGKRAVETLSHTLFIISLQVTFSSKASIQDYPFLVGCSIIRSTILGVNGSLRLSRMKIWPYRKEAMHKAEETLPNFSAVCLTRTDDRGRFVCANLRTKFYLSVWV